MFYTVGPSTLVVVKSFSRNDLDCIDMTLNQHVSFSASLQLGSGAAGQARLVS